MTFLRDKGWGDGHLDETLEHMLNEESEKTKRVLDDLVKDEKVVSILTIKDEFHNLKAAIKQVCTEDETENIFMAGCKIEPEFLKVRENTVNYLITWQELQKKQLRFF